MLYGRDDEVSSAINAVIAEFDESDQPAWRDANTDQCVRIHLQKKSSITSKADGIAAACRVCTNKGVPCVRLFYGQPVFLPIPAGLRTDDHRSKVGYWLKQGGGKAKLEWDVQ